MFKGSISVPKVLQLVSRFIMCQQSYLPDTPPVDMRFQLSFPLPTADLSASFTPRLVDAMPLNLLSMKALNSFFSLAKMSRTGGKKVWSLTQIYFVGFYYYLLFITFFIKDQCKKVSLLGKQTFKFASAFFNGVLIPPRLAQHT